MKKGEKRRQELIRLAYRLFVADGYEHTSVDEIIEKAGIAKGTFYYYFQSKEQMLGEVIEMMLAAEAEQAEAVLRSDLSVPEKIVGIVASIRPARDEKTIGDALHRPENIIMHNRIRGRIFDLAVPLLARAVEEGVRQGLFSCDRISERVRMLTVLGSDLFDGSHPLTPESAGVFVDAAEKILGAAPGTMGFLLALARAPGGPDGTKGPERTEEERTT